MRMRKSVKRYMSLTDRPQVGAEHYRFVKYARKNKWMSYWHQITTVLSLKPKNLLEIGTGDGTVSSCLAKEGIDVTTFDFDKKLHPDVVGNVLELSRHFRNHSFDVVLCAEVLEHLPFKYFDDCLSEIAKVAHKWFILTLPHVGINFNIIVDLPKFHKKRLKFKMPTYKNYEFEGQHYWEIGWKKYPLSLIQGMLSRHFSIKKSYCLPESFNHRLFILKARK
jgi:hypothetical protein